MRRSIKKLIEKTFVLEFKLPHGIIDKTSITTLEDYCYSSNDSDVSESIYNSIIDYCLNDHEINVKKLNDVQQKALRDRLNFSHEDELEDQNRYGFFGEVLLNIMLQVFFGTNKIIAKGRFYDPTEDQELKGFDSFHFVKNKSKVQLWFGEAKMHKTISSAASSVVKNINKALSEEYYDKNVRAVFDRSPLFNDKKTIRILKKIIKLIATGPFNKDIIRELKMQNIDMFYPILIIYNDNSLIFDDKIINAVSSVETQLLKITPKNEIDAEILFLFVPVNDVTTIKAEVIEWISDQKPIK